jgi:hypothetical protein
MICKTYSIQNKCCSLLYNNPFKVNMRDIDSMCNGISDKTKCCWYKSPYLNEVELRAERNVLRNMRRRLGIIQEKKHEK